MRIRLRVRIPLNPKNLGNSLRPYPHYLPEYKAYRADFKNIFSAYILLLYN